MTIDDHDKRFRVAMEVTKELNRSYELYGKFYGSHEGYAVLLEELDELWDEVKKRKRDLPSMRREAIQISAMAIKFVLDICNAENQR